MRTEDIVGFSFFAILFPAIVITIAASRKTLPQAQARNQRSLGLALVSLALIAFGIANYYFIHTSPKLVVEGNLWNIRGAFSKNERGTRFMITDSTGHAVPIRCRYTGPGLREGDRARIQYVAYNNHLLEIEMLSGPYQFWHLSESSGEYRFWWFVAIGLVCGFFSIRQRRQAAEPQPTAQ